MKKNKKLLQSITLGLLLGGSLYAAQPAWAAPTFAGGTGTDSTVAGVNVTASGAKSFAAGYGSKAKGANSIAIGINTSTSSTSSNATANGSNSISIGVDSVAGNTDGTGSSSIAIGSSAKAAGNYATAVGASSSASRQYASAFGYYARANGDYDTSIGYYTSASGSGYATAVGYKDSAGGKNASAVGYYNTASASDASAMGNQNYAYGLKSSSLGSHNTTGNANVSGFGENASAVGNSNTAVGYDSNAFGSHNQVGLIMYNPPIVGLGATPIFPSDFGFDTAIANYASAMGYSNSVFGEHSSAFGAGNTTGTAMLFNGVLNGAYASAMGDSNTAFGNYSSAFGYGNLTGFSGFQDANYSSAMGTENKSYSDYASAFGAHNTAGNENEPIKGFASSAMGYGNITNADFSSAMGYSNATYANHSSAIGRSNVTGSSLNSDLGYSSAAVGNNNFAYGNESSAFGAYNTAGFIYTEEEEEPDGPILRAAAAGTVTKAGGDRAVAMGAYNVANSNWSSAIGYQNTVGDQKDPDSAESSVAMGYNNTVYSAYANAMGVYNRVGDEENPEVAEYASAIGGWNEAYGLESSSIGQGNISHAYDSSAVGAYNTAYGKLSVAVGSFSTAYTDNSVALGINAQAGVKDSTEATTALAIGLAEPEYGDDDWVKYDDNGNPVFTGGAFATANKAIAIGYNTTSSAESAIAIGTNATAELKDSVALGSESLTGTSIPELGEYTYIGKKLTFAGSEPMSVVSVGAEGKERRIINVAAGRISSTSTDAINGSQLYALAGVINSRINDVISGMPQVEAGENITVDVTETPIGGEAGSGTEIADTEDPAEITQKTYTVNGEGGGGVATEVKAGKNISSVDLETAEDGHNIYTVNAENMRVTGGSVMYDVKGEGTLSITSGEGKNAVTTEIKGLKNNVTNLDSVNTTLENNTNLKVSVTTKEDGKPVTKESSVDLSDLKTKQGDANAEAIEGLKGMASDNVQQLNRLDNKINKVGAHAAALAALHPLDFDPDDKLHVAAGYGHYRGEDAGAVGAFYRPDEKVMFSVAGTTGSGEHMINAGLTFSLDRTPRQTRSKTAMARDIMDLRDIVMKQQEQISQLNKLVLQLTGHPEESRDIFPDVPENHWAYEYVKGLCEDGVLTGYPDGTFSGDRHMTRYEFAAMLRRAMLKGVVISDRAAKEFAPELGRFRVDRVHGEDDDNHKIERIRVNGNHDYGRDNYGSKNPQAVTSRGPQYPEADRVKK